MKKVRFESPLRPIKRIAMHEAECHSPRPFIQKQIKAAPHVEYMDYQAVPFTNDPVKKFECANSSPYPTVNSTTLPGANKIENRRLPSNELELSILDSTHTSPKNMHNPKYHAGHKFNSQPRYSAFKTDSVINKTSDVLNPMKNCVDQNPPNVMRKNEDFFLRRDNLTGYQQLTSELNKLHLDKENNPFIQKSQIMMMSQTNLPLQNVDHINSNDSLKMIDNISCRCHHCVKVCNVQHIEHPVEIVNSKSQNINRNSYNTCHCLSIPQNHLHYACNIPTRIPYSHNCDNTEAMRSPVNAVDKKTWAIQKYEQNGGTNCLEVEKQTNISVEKTEPTVADLFKIIKMQSEQLQLLQEKVEKFITSNTHKEHKTNPPIHNYVTEQVALETVETEKKISIGVMTSFEVVRTSTIINKEFLKQSEAQIQCNRSQISIKEVVSKQPSNLNFLDGLTPVSKDFESNVSNKSNPMAGTGDVISKGDYNDDKTLNEMSLYNVQVDNAITPNISPEQSLYLDIRDYSDSDASSDDQSNVGWTYYNKVMTHVNGMLQESDMPSSASALYRNVRQKCMQMQIDKSNVSVAKRVTFGDDPIGLHKPHIPTATSDTSFKMKQLAAKYLQNDAVMSNTHAPRTTDMSLATKNYMENHILRGTNVCTGEPQLDIPKFLDITALKKQPKLL